MDIKVIPNHSGLTDMPSSSNTDHDGRYYTEDEIDALVALVDLDAVLAIGDTSATHSITLTNGTLTANTITDGTFSVTGGVITGATNTNWDLAYAHIGESGGSHSLLQADAGTASANKALIVNNTLDIDLVTGDLTAVDLTASGTITDGIASLVGGALSGITTLGCGAINSTGNVTINGGTNVTECHVFQKADGPQYGIGVPTAGIRVSGYDNEDDKYLNFSIEENGWGVWGGNVSQITLSPANTTVRYLNVSGCAFKNDKYFRFGSSTTQMAIFEWNTSQTINTFALGLDDNPALHGRYMLIADEGDISANYNFAHTAQLNPTIFIHSAAASTTQWLSLTHNGDNGVINTGLGAIDMKSPIILPAGTMAAGTAPLKFTTGIALTTPEAGALEYHDSRLYLTNVATRKALDRTSDVEISTTTVANTDVETALMVIPMPANSLVVGNIFKLHADGVISNDGNSSDNDITIRVRIGSITGTAVLTLLLETKALTDDHWDFDANATQRTLGANGSRALHAHVAIIDGVDCSVHGENCAVGLDTVDTTATMDVYVTAQWATADANNTISLYQGFIEFKN